MKAELLHRERSSLSDAAFLEFVIWRVPVPLMGSHHHFKYRMVLINDGECVLRYDNEAGKGDHKHIGDAQLPYYFRGVDALLEDFLADVAEWSLTK